MRGARPEKGAGARSTHETQGIRARLENEPGLRAGVAEFEGTGQAHWPEARRDPSLRATGSGDSRGDELVCTGITRQAGDRRGWPPLRATEGAGAEGRTGLANEEPLEGAPLPLPVVFRRQTADLFLRDRIAALLGGSQEEKTLLDVGC